jgi:hypothetical protein
MAAAAACAVLLGTTALAQVAPLTAPQRANVQLVINNLNTLVTAGRATVPANSNAEKDVQKRAQLDRLAEISANLTAKLAAGSIHSVPGLKDGKPPAYHHDDENGAHARAVYCDDQTFVGNAPCPEGDILVDPSIIDPGNGTAIDETTLEGWKQKWTLVHVLAHEKMHEIMINAEVKALKGTQGWKVKTPAQKEELTGQAKRDGASKDKHQEVYEWQKTVLRWERTILEACLKTLQAAKPPDKDAIQAAKDKIEWLKKTVDELEKAMAAATGGVELVEILECVPEVPANGYIQAVVVAPGLTWSLEALRSGGVTQSVTTLWSDWLGERIEEHPAHPPAMVLTMSERVLSAGEVQPDLCNFIAESMAGGDLRIAHTGKSSTLKNLLGHVSIGVGVGSGGEDRGRRTEPRHTQPPQTQAPPRPQN